jgi:hypothetical protein
LFDGTTVATLDPANYTLAGVIAALNAPVSVLYAAAGAAISVSVSAGRSSIPTLPTLRL